MRRHLSQCAHQLQRHQTALELHGLSRGDPSSPVSDLFGTAHSAPVSLTAANQELRPRFSGHNVLIVNDGNAVEPFKNHKQFYTGDFNAPTPQGLKARNEILDDHSAINEVVEERLASYPCPCSNFNNTTWDSRDLGAAGSADNITISVN